MGARKHKLTDYELRQREAARQEDNREAEERAQGELQRIAAEVLLGFIGHVGPVATAEDARAVAKRIAEAWMNDL